MSKIFLLFAFNCFSINNLFAQSNNLPNAKMSGYADKISVMPGDTLFFKTSTVADKFSATIMRFGMKIDTLKIIDNIAGKLQNIPDSSWSRGCRWQTTFSFVIPLNSKPGIYSALLKDSKNTLNWVTFIVKPVQNGRAPFIVLIATNTWNAYNQWGGKSSYRPNDSISHLISYDRPNPFMNPILDGYNHTAATDVLLLSWLEKNGYDYDTFSDVDLHSTPFLLNKYKKFILGSHSEYWSFQMRDRLRQFLDNGGNLIYLGGNGIFWKVTFDSTNKIMECRKNLSIHSQTGERGGHWGDLQQSEAKILGVEFSGAGWFTFAPYKIKKASHWIFQGTNLVNGDSIGNKGLNGIGASGWETDKISRMYSPSNIELLAKGTNPKNSGADMIYYDHPGKGYVFSVGSLSFVGSLIIDSTLTKIVKNALDGKKTPDTVHNNETPTSFALEQNYPNPFNPSTTIEFSVATQSHIRISISDVLGRTITELVNEVKNAGTYQAQWDASNFSTGIYFYRIDAGKFNITKKMILTK